AGLGGVGELAAAAHRAGPERVLVAGHDDLAAGEGGQAADVVVVRVGEDDLLDGLRARDPGRVQCGHRVQEHGAAAGRAAGRGETRVDDDGTGRVAGHPEEVVH